MRTSAFTKTNAGNIFKQSKNDNEEESLIQQSEEGKEGEGEAGSGNGLVLTNCYKMALKSEPKLATGDDVLTEFFRGGFVPKKIYEIYGESGSGKTQFAIQLLLQSLLPENLGGLGGQSLYLMTGKPLNEKRFLDI